VATFTWTGDVSSDWTTNGNWSQSGTPGSSDDVVIGSATPSPTLSASATVNMVTIDGSDTLTLSGETTTLTATDGVTLSSAGIIGVGTIAAAVTATAAASITASGGSLTLADAVTDTGNALTLTIAGATDALAVEATSTVHAVTFGSSGVLELSSNTLTDNTALAVGAGSVELFGSGATLADASGVTLSTGKIVDTGTIAAAVTATGAATIEADGGNLELEDAITNTGNALTLTIFSSDRLKLDVGGAAHTVNIDPGSTLELGSGSSLSVATAMAIGSGNVQLDGGGATFTDNAGVTLSSGTITGAGVFEGNFMTVTGAGNITATGGELDIDMIVDDSGGMLTLKIAGASDILSLGQSTTVESVSFGSTGTLSILNDANLTVSTLMEIGAGTVQLGAGSGTGTLTDTLGVTLAGGSIAGFGKLNATINGTGIVTAEGGTLELVDGIAASEGSSFEISNNSNSVLLLDAAPGAGNTFTFLGANGDLALANDTGFDDTIAGLNVGTGGAKTNFVDIEGHTVTITGESGQGTTSGSITLSDGAVLTLTDLSSTNWFANTVTDGNTGTDVFVSDTPCYCRGTLIRTERGEVPIEALLIGARVVTLSGALRPVKWIGRRSYAGHFIAGNRGVLPIRVETGALSDGVPRRDLWVSPHHALYLDGVLVPAECLVNGVSIVQAEAVARVDYFHIELDSHDVIWAEGAPAETFVDCDSRGMFQNAAEFATRYPGEAPPAWAFCAQRVEDGERVAALWRQLAARAGIAADPAAPGELQGHLDAADSRTLRGWARDAAHPDLPVTVEITVDGAAIGLAFANTYRPDLAAAGFGHGRHGFDFTLPQPLVDGRPHVIAARRACDGLQLAQSPRLIDGSRRAA
jgi:Hint domain